MFPGVTAKSFEVVFLRKYKNIFNFVLSQRRNRQTREGEMKFSAHRTSHLTSISHLTSKRTHDALCHPARWRQWEDARMQEAWPRCRLEAYAGGEYDIG